MELPIDLKEASIHPMARLTIELDRETDGRWIAEVIELPGVMAYGDTKAAALINVETLALRVIADKLEHGEPIPGASSPGELSLSFAAA